MKDKKTKISRRHIFKNTVYMLKILHKVAPELLFANIGFTIGFSVINFIAGTYTLRYMINGYQNGLPFFKIIAFMITINIIMIVNDFSFNAYNNIRGAAVYLKVKSHIDKELFYKSSQVELACYENPKFFDNYIKASNDAVNRVYQVMYSITRVISWIVNLSMYSFLVLTIDSWLIVFAFIPVITAFTVGKKRNVTGHEFDMKRQEQERQRDYTRRVFYLSDYAKEMRLTAIHIVMLKRFDAAVKNIIAYIKKYGFRLAAIDYIREETHAVLSGMGAMLYAVYRTVVSGTMMYGDCAVIINSIDYIAYILSESVDMVMDFHKHSLYIDNLRIFLEYEPKIKGGNEKPSGRGGIEFRNVSFRYDGADSDVLKNLNFTIGENEKIALVGHNGAGKSTLVKLLLRLYDPTEGCIYYDKKDIREYDLSGDENYRRLFGAVFQDFRTFSFSVEENVLLREKAGENEDIVDYALKQSGIYEKIMSLPQKEKTILTREFDENGAVLSGGEEQKISIARAFARKSKFVILDEPSSALDPVAEYKMYENMMKVCESKAVVFISHRLSSAVLADRIYLLENGKIIESGSHSEMMAAKGKYAEMFTLQAQNYTEQEAAEQ